MRTIINVALDHLDSLTHVDNRASATDIEPLVDTLQQVQDAYVELIHGAISSLMRDDLQESHDLLQEQRRQLESTLVRIAQTIEEVGDATPPLKKLVLEYLYTRTRLVDDIKMFPDFVLIQLERYTIDESIGETIHYMEHTMTGKQNLFSELLASIEEIKSDG